MLFTKNMTSRLTGLGLASSRRAMNTNRNDKVRSTTRLFSTLEEDCTPADPKTLDFENMGFGYVPTKSMVVYNYTDKDGWDSGTLSTTPYLKIHALSNVIHYGQSIFEGHKVFHLKDGRVCAFNPKANANRMKQGALRMGMPVVPEEIFLNAVADVVKDNVDYVPPYGSGGSFYIRPFLTGYGAQLGLGQAPNYMFSVIGCPVGNYYKAGIKPIHALVMSDFDRAAPRGTGHVKCAGNYAADVMPAKQATSAGFEIALYLDAKHNKYIEEFSTSNVIGITQDGKTLVTPESDSILPSITNQMLQQLAKDKGLNVERRPVEFDELKTFSELGACGTAVIISPIGSVTRGDEKITFSDQYPVLQGLYNDLRAIQTGEAEDVHGWLYEVCRK